MYVIFKSGKVGGELVTREFEDVRDFFKFESATVTPPGASISIMPSTQVEAARLLELLAEHLANRTSPPELLADWFARSTRKPLDEPKPDQAIAKHLGLAKWTRGRPSDPYREFAIHRRMQQLIDTGSTVLEAKLKCADEFHTHEANIEKCYYRCRKFLESCPF